MIELASGLFVGAVTHTRLRPRRHHLKYRLFQMLIDLDELPSLHSRLKLFGHNRPGALSFYDRDHGDGRAGPLRGYVDALLARHDLDLDGGPITLLCMPRLFGHVFNPISIYYCRKPGGRLVAMLYEVNNTFGERHSYLIPVGGPETSLIRQACDKQFYVSPFMDMDLQYAFALSHPGETLQTTISAADAAGAPILTASFAGCRKPITDANLALALVSHPLMTLKVVAAIHWEALLIFRKGVGLRARPAPPTEPVTLVRLPSQN